MVEYVKEAHMPPKLVFSSEKPEAVDVLCGQTVPGCLTKMLSGSDSIEHTCTESSCTYTHSVDFPSRRRRRLLSGDGYDSAENGCLSGWAWSDADGGSCVELLVIVSAP